MLLRRTDRRTGEVPAASAFTLVELLIVLTVIGLLATIVVPAFTRAVELARSAICQNQMRMMSHHLVAEGADGIDLQHRLGITVPDFSRWEATLVEVGVKHLTLCPSDIEPLQDPFLGFKDLYFVQVSTEGGHEGTFKSPLYEMMESGEPNDKQICYMYQGTTYVGDYYSDPASYPWEEYLEAVDGELDDNQLLMTAGSGSIVVTFHDTHISITETDIRPEWTSQYGGLIGSDHYLAWGDPDEGDWQDDTVRQFIGKNNLEAAKQFVKLAKVSYGMNSLVANYRPNFNQIWLAEYTVSQINFDRGDPVDQPFDGTRDNGEIMDRHLGKANVMFVRGDVTRMTKAQLQAEHDSSEGAFHP